MKQIRTFFLILVLFSLACQMPIRAAQQEQEQTPIPVATEAAGQLEDQMATAAAELEQTGQVTVTISEAQLTAFVAEQLSANGGDVLTDPQVKLRNGKIEVTGKASVGFLTADAIVILQPYAEQGKLRLSIEEAKFGAVPIPDATLDTLTNTLNQNLDNFTTVNGREFWLETVTVEDGFMTLSGNLE
jgi:uncharacterized protein YpmS